MSPISFSRRLFLTRSSLLGLGLLSGCSTVNVLEPFEPGHGMDTTGDALPLVNALRARHDLPPLFHDHAAVNAAKDQSRRMARLGKMSHFLGSDASFLDRMKRLSVELPAAENIAAGQKTTHLAYEAWVGSKKHLDNMLGSFRGLGVAVSFQSARADRPYWSMILSNPQA